MPVVSVVPAASGDVLLLGQLQDTVLLLETVDAEEVPPVQPALLQGVVPVVVVEGEDVGTVLTAGPVLQHVPGHWRVHLIGGRGEYGDKKQGGQKEKHLSDCLPG